MTNYVNYLEEQMKRLSKNLTIKKLLCLNGGVNRVSAKESGIDPKHFREIYRYRRKELFPAHGGMTMDGIAELLNQYNYCMDANSVIDLIESVLSVDRFVDSDIEAQAKNLELQIDKLSAEEDHF